MSKPTAAELLTATRAELSQARAELAALREALAKERETSTIWVDRMARRVQAAEAREARARALLADVLETTASCHCEEAYTGRGLHAPECHYDEVDEARAFLDPRRDDAARERHRELIRMTEEAGGYPEFEAPPSPCCALDGKDGQHAPDCHLDSCTHWKGLPCGDCGARDEAPRYYVDPVTHGQRACTCEPCLFGGHKRGCPARRDEEGT